MAKERADGLTLDSPIVETGMDSLERMEILASLEEKFGGRFPEEILPDLETTRQLVAAVEKYLGREPRTPSVRAADAEIQPSTYRFDQFPEYVKLRENLEMLEASGLGNPFFAVHDGPTMDRTLVGGRELINFSSYNYLGMSGDPSGSARPPRQPSTVTAPVLRPAGWCPAKKAFTSSWRRRLRAFSARKTRSPWWAATPRTRR